MKKHIVLGLFLMLPLLMAGCSKPQTPQPNSVTIGVAGPLTGDAGSYGENLRAGIELALSKYSGNVKVRLIYEDSGCDGKTGANAFQKLTNVDNVDLIIGPICSAAGSAGLPFTTKSNVPVIIPGASANGLATLGNNIFRIYPSDGLQGKFAAQYAFEKLQKKNATVIYRQDDWGQAIQDIFIEEFKRLGGNIELVQATDPSEKDFRTILTKIKESATDVLYIPLGSESGLALLRQMQELGISLPAIGGDFLLSEDFYTQPIAEGTMITSGKISNPEEFQQMIKTQSTASVDAVNILAPLGYDAMNIALQGFEQVGTDHKAMIEYLKNLEYTDGVSLPEISFDDNGDLENAKFKLQIVKDGNLVDL
ncbi:penicillin-binding protein activator [Candidatus Nomurabacteria bacterium]|nr:penicillin-binding protein activator [Candidatus Nomurabacteria bacterium]